MSKKVAQVLEKEGPLLSGTLAKELVTLYGISPEAARKEISRSKKPVKRINTISFENNQRFFYLEEQTNKAIYYERLLKAIEEQSKAYSYFIRAVKFHDGFIDSAQLPAYTCSPIKPLKGHKLASAIINDLCSSNILVEFSDDMFQLNQLLEEISNFPRHKALEMAKKTIMLDFKEWARNINLASYNTVKVLSEVPEFFKLQWSLSSPSYIMGLTKGNLPGFLVADVLIGKHLVEEDVEYFIKKINILQNNSKVARFIPFLLVDSIEEKAFKILKAKGVVLGFIDQIFGSQYSKMLRSLISIVENASVVITKDPDKYFQLLDNLSVLEGKSFNLKGDLFEFAVGYYYSQSAQFLEVNKNILERNSGKRK